MAAPASLALLKPKNKAAETAVPAEETKVKEAVKTATEKPVEKQAPQPAEKQAEAAETQTYDIEKMSGAELDKLVKEQEIEVPETWAKMKVAEKRKWLNDKFGDDGSAEGEAAQTSEVQAATSTPAKAESKTAKALETGKAKTPVKVVTGEIMEGKDALHDMVHEIENLKEKEAKVMIATLLNQGGEGEFKVGGVLAKVMESGWYAPYSSFREFVENEHGLHYRKALNMIEIYNALIEAKVPWDKIKHLGWTKIQRMAKVLSEENAAQWIAVAEKQTVLQLEATVKNAKDQDEAKTTGSAAQDGEAVTKTVTTMTFKVHEDQKATIEAALEKAKEAGNTTVSTVALEYVCMDYLGATKSAPLKDQLVKAGLEGAVEALSEAFPDANIKIEVPEE
jgi:hypothetical protein